MNELLNILNDSIKDDNYGPNQKIMIMKIASEYVTNNKEVLVNENLIRKR